MDKRLSLSATKTEEVVLALNKYEMDIKKIVNDRVSSIEASDIIEELNSHVVAVNIENNYLREQNDNLKHDLSNLIEMMKRRIGDQNIANDRNDACLTFCDVDPEDIFGPIEAIISPNGGCFVDEGVQVEINDQSLSRCSSVSNQTKFLVEEKELLVCKLQEHLQTISNELQLKDEVVRNLETKLNTTRKDNLDVRTALTQMNQKYDDCEQRLQEAIDRVSVLNEHKRSLMTQLDEESEQRIKFKEELKSLTTRLLENMKTVEQQSVTIQYLREAIVAKCKSDSTQLNGISHNSSPQHL